MEWARILAYITGTVDQDLLLRNEYLAAENRILRLKYSNTERAKLSEIAHRLGRKSLGEIATAAHPDTILAWYRRLIARKFDGSKESGGAGASVAVQCGTTWERALGPVFKSTQKSCARRKNAAGRSCKHTESQPYS
jgi:hypothetical protein